MKLSESPPSTKAFRMTGTLSTVSFNAPTLATAPDLDRDATGWVNTEVQPHSSGRVTQIELC